jgi:hypothetical protein
MATIVTPSNNTDSGVGMVLGVVVVIALIAAFFLFVLPAIREGNPPSDGGANINVTLPESPAGGQ